MLKASDQSISPEHQILLWRYFSGDKAAYLSLQSDLTNHRLSMQNIIDFLFANDNFLENFFRIPPEFFSEFLRWYRQKEISLTSKRLQIISLLLISTNAVKSHSIIADNFAILTPRDIARLYNFFGNIFYAKKDFTKAYADYCSAINFDPENACYYGNRGILYYTMQQYAFAIVDLQKAIKLEPKKTALYKFLANAYFELVDYTRAVSTYTAAIQQNPIDPSMYEDRAVIYRWQKDFAAAVADYLTAIKMYIELLRTSQDLAHKRTIFERIIDICSKIKACGVKLDIADDSIEKVLADLHERNMHTFLTSITASISQSPSTSVLPVTSSIAPEENSNSANSHGRNAHILLAPITASTNQPLPNTSPTRTALVIPLEKPNQYGPQCRLI